MFVRMVTSGWVGCEKVFGLGSSKCVITNRFICFFFYINRRYFNKEKRKKKVVICNVL